MFLTYLRCQILGGPAECFHSGGVRDAFLTQTEICDLYMAVLIQHEVLQLKTHSYVILNTCFFMFNNNMRVLYTFRSR